MKIITVCGSLRFYKERIKLSDAILVVNVDGYIGSTKSEIEFAQSLGKEILYYID